MKPNAMRVAMVQTAVKKGIKDIKEEPRRGIRNLVEMGGLFATGRFQQDFFAMAMGQLHDESSAYYRIVERVVKTIDEDTLLTFGTNLGYNALTHGAGVIRSIEQTKGFNVPWCLIIELGEPPLDIASVIQQGMELGIYCYIFNIPAGYSGWETLRDTLHARKECAFFLFLHPLVITSAVGQSLLELHNVMSVLDMDGVSDHALKPAIDGLFRGGAPLAGFTRCGDTIPEDLSSNLLQRAEALDVSVLVLVRTKKHRPQNEDDAYHQVVQLRKGLEVPVLPIDLYGDIAHADRIISSEACLAAIRSDGSVTLTNVDERETVSGHNIRTAPLQEILRCSMPKRTGPEKPRSG